MGDCVNSPLIYAYSLQSEHRIVNHLFRTIASLKFLDDAIAVEILPRACQRRPTGAHCPLRDCAVLCIESSRLSMTGSYVGSKKATREDHLITTILKRFTDQNQ